MSWLARTVAGGLAGVVWALAATAGDRPAWEQRLLPANDDWRQTKQQFTFNNGSEPKTCDPTLVTGVPEARLVDALFEGLTALDPETLEPRPGVAESWQVSADGLTYTFKLREAACWTNRRPVTALDFLKSWERALAPATGASYAYQLFPIRGAEEFHAGKVKDFAQVGVAAPDLRTLVVTLRAPCSYFLMLTAFHTLYPVPVEVIAQFGDRWILPENIVSNGPFQMKTWEPRQRIQLVRSPTYWDRDIVKLEQVTVLPYDDLDTAYRLFRQGQLHYMDGVPLPKLDEVRRNPCYFVHPYLGTYFYRFNVTKPPLDDARVRRALCLAIDRSVITDHVLRAGQKPTGALCPPVAGYQPVPGLKYDKEQARQLLQDAGYGPGGKPWPAVEILYNTSEAHKQVAEAIAQQWQTNLGVTVSLRNAEWQVYLSDMDQLNYQIIRASWIGDYPDPNTFFDLFVTNGGNNRTGWTSAEYDKLLAQTQVERDAPKRLAMFQQMERLLVEQECPIMPIYTYVTQGLLSESVYGWYDNVRDWHPLKYVWLED